jgi:hypothetical protein
VISQAIHKLWLLLSKVTLVQPKTVVQYMPTIQPWIHTQRPNCGSGKKDMVLQASQFSLTELKGLTEMQPTTLVQPVLSGTNFASIHFVHKFLLAQ